MNNLIFTLILAFPFGHAYAGNIESESAEVTADLVSKTGGEPHLDSSEGEEVEEDLVGKLKQQSLAMARENLLDSQITISKSVKDKDSLIRPEIQKVQNIEESIVNEINLKREQIKTFIYGVASTIENGGEIDITTNNTGISIEKIIEAKNRNNVTARSVKMAFDILSKINNELIKRANKEKDPKIKRDLALQEAALVYEMTDLTIEIVNDAVLDGSPILKKYKQDEESKINKDINELESSISDLESQYKLGEIKESFYENMKQSYKNQIEVNVTLLNKWKDIGVIFDNQDKQIDQIKRDVKNLEHIRKNALFQINILKRAKFVEVVNSTMGSINDLIDISSGLVLIKLDSSYFSDICVGDCPSKPLSNGVLE